MYLTMGRIPHLTQSHRESFQDILGRIERGVKDTRRIPNTIHHYTGSSGFLGILESAHIRATHIAYMNDAHEYRISTSLFSQKIKSLLQKGSTNKDLSACFDKISKILDEEEPEKYPPIFISCFCTKANKINQWRAYSTGDGGFSSGIRSTNLEEKFYGWRFLLPVIYDEKLLESFADKFIKWCILTFPAHLKDRDNIQKDDFINSWSTAVYKVICFIASVFKDSAFEEESEVRIVSFLEEDKIKFNPKSSVLSPYIDIDLRREGKGKNQMSINEVWAGPGRYVHHNFASIRGLLHQLKYPKVTVQKSAIQYRVG